MSRRRTVALASFVLVITMIDLSWMEGESVTVEVPVGSTLPEIAEILDERGVVRSARLFPVYARARQADRKLKAGTYHLPTGSSMRRSLLALTRGEVETVALTIPEGFRLRQMAPRIAAVISAMEERSGV